MTRGFLSEGSGHERSDFVTVDVRWKLNKGDGMGFYDPKDWSKLIWLPRSLVTIEGCDGPDGKGTATMPRWLAVKKGLV